ncbi:MAG: hypothetical protein IJU76_08585 [Desulfovibrionaceae bacterium]|nr:hypothetical protein [Desulfovibrionaceae bacterium]
MNAGLLYIVDDQGTIQAVQIQYDLWKKIEDKVLPLLKNKETKELTQREAPLKDFSTLMQHWDFPYPYSPKVICPKCQASTEDWQNDPNQSFILKNASLGGLLVFQCRSCGTTIRHKFFKDHVCYEHTTPNNT